MRLKIQILFCLTACFVGGCQPRVSSSSVTDGPHNMDCLNDSVLKDGICLCDDGSKPLGEGWYCVSDAQRCMRQAGCQVGEKKYPIGTEYRNSSFVCGNVPLPESPMDYFCEAFWRCGKEECQCGDEIIKEYEACPKNSVPKVLKEEQEQEENQRSCSDRGWEKGYICENNAWICKSEDEKDEIRKAGKIRYCGGISSDAIKSNNYDYKCRYNHWVCNNVKGCSCFDGVSTKKVQYGDICENTKDSCKNAAWPQGAAHIKYNSGYYVKFGDRYYLSETDTDFEQGTDDNVCLQESCPCGDGACMKFGKCKSGVCWCENLKTNVHDAFYCASYVRDDESLPDGNMGETGGLLICLKDGGCRTRDARHYPQGAVIGFNGHDDFEYAPNDAGCVQHAKDLARRDALMFHIDAGFDTTIESTSEFGECVLDRKDNLVRYSDAKDAQQYICDQAECACGKNTCAIGEICAHGKCRPDTCQAHGKTRQLCDVDLNNGQRSFPHPEKPEQCIIATDERVHHDLYYGHFGDIEQFKTDMARILAYRDKEEPDAKTSTAYYDVLACKGGHRYCHGKNNAPIKAPDKLDGYACLEVSELPGIDAKDHLKAWACKDQKGCACGSEVCPHNHACIDGACILTSPPTSYCMGRPLEEGYRCGVHRNGYLSSTREIGPVCDQETCTCGDTQCRRDMLCSEGRCFPSVGGLFPLSPGYDAKGRCMNSEKGCRCNGEMHDISCDVPCFGDGRLDEEGCWCGNKRIENIETEICFKSDDQYTILCNSPTGCDCAETKCPMTTYCDAGQCIDPLTRTSIAQSSHNLAPVSSCNAPHCTCAGTTCHQGEFCTGGMCKSSWFAKISKGKRYYYNTDMIQDAFKSTEESIWEAWEDSPKLTQLLTDLIESENRDIHESQGYAITPYYKTYPFCCDDMEKVLRTDKIRCSLSDGCSCGKTKCLYGAECMDGQCIYDKQYFENYCGSSHASLVGDLCFCNGTFLPPTYQSGYACSEKGWACEKEGGCLCGDVPCSEGSYCIKPSVCVNPDN